MRTIRIIDNKKIALTGDEWKMYEEICASYNRTRFKGSDLFKDLFETDTEGRITFLRPPRQQTSHEVIYFLITVMTHQYLSESCQEVSTFLEEGQALLAELRQLKSQLSSVEPAGSVTR